VNALLSCDEWAQNVDVKSLKRDAVLRLRDVLLLLVSVRSTRPCVTKYRE
jgi:hypothetical protein